ncbi:MAG: hypothetical protein K6G62_01560 [Eubacterium sp.]|nr:hypothetical protein [Eubacterium sp.]
MKTISDKTRKNIVGFSFIMCLIVIGSMAVYYQYMKRQRLDAAVQTPTTEVEKLIAKDLNQGYPETPTEVMKLWGRLNQCMYNTTLTEEEDEALFKQLRLMYSKDLIAENAEETHRSSLKSELTSFKDEKKKIVSYSAETGTAVQYKTINERECAYITISYFINENRNYSKSFQDFILVKEGGKWKILGFKAKSQASSSKEEAASNTTS